MLRWSHPRPELASGSSDQLRWLKLLQLAHSHASWRGPGSSLDRIAKKLGWEISARTNDCSTESHSSSWTSPDTDCLCVLGIQDHLRELVCCRSSIKLVWFSSACACVSFSIVHVDTVSHPESECSLHFLWSPAVLAFAIFRSGAVCLGRRGDSYCSLVVCAFGSSHYGSFWFLLLRALSL